MHLTRASRRVRSRGGFHNRDYGSSGNDQYRRERQGAMTPATEGFVHWPESINGSVRSVVGGHSAGLVLGRGRPQVILDLD